MYNPYALLTPGILAAMLRQPMYFVRQHYPRGRLNEKDSSIPLLFTHYIHHDTDKERAARHMRLIRQDPYRFLYNSAHPDHLEKLRMAASQPAGYRIYINLLPKKWKAPDALKLKISRYVKEKLPCWKFSPKDKLHITLKERYGALFMALLWRGGQTEVLLDNIENFCACATT